MNIAPVFEGAIFVSTDRQTKVQHNSPVDCLMYRSGQALTDPGRNDILEIAKRVGIDRQKAKRILKNIQECVDEKLRVYIR